MTVKAETDNWVPFEQQQAHRRGKHKYLSTTPGGVKGVEPDVEVSGLASERPRVNSGKMGRMIRGPKP